MEKQYTCPLCGGHLRIRENIIFLAKNKKHEKGIILLHSEIGNYQSIKHPSFEFEEGELLEFLCPICHKSLASDFDDRLTHVLLEEKGEKFDIYFSRIAGEQSTYKVDSNKVVTATGVHADRYTYFKMSDRFKRYLRM
ncbi:hypothetical protein ACFLSA_06685 [Bacteroidota bacterium]